jgi:hypothetical protein
MSAADTAASQASTGAGNIVHGPQKHTLKQNAEAVAAVARKLGVDPVLAVADMLSEGVTNTNIGDGGTSFGLFGLHEGGALPKAWYPGQPGHDNAFDPTKNATVALTRFAQLKGTYSGAELAYQSERPANHDAYIKAVNGHMKQARQLVGQ